jgi:hypothetical protein
MRIKNKYLRNRLFKNKAWNRAKNIEGGEFSRKYFTPYWFHEGEFIKISSVEEQHQSHINWIKEWVYTFVNGGKRGTRHANKTFRKNIERCERHKVKNVISKILKDVNNVDEYDIPQFKHDADWDWF